MKMLKYIYKFANQVFPIGNSLCYLMNTMHSINKNNHYGLIREFIEIIKFSYTVKLNKVKLAKKIAHKANVDERMESIPEVTETTLWGYGMDTIIPATRMSVKRTRFELLSIDVFNCIARELKLSEDCFLKGVTVSKVKFKLDSDEEKSKYVLAWLLFLLLVNNCEKTNSTEPTIDGWSYLVFGNSRLSKYVQVSIENIIVRFSMLSELVELLNVEILGFSEDEFQKVVEKLLQQNRSAVEMSELLVCNTDLIQSIYSLPPVRYKQRAEDFDRTEKIIERFLQLVNAKMDRIKKEYGYDFSYSNEAFINFRYGNGDVLNIPQLYANLVNKAVSNIINANNDLEDGRIQNDISEFISYLDGENIVLPAKIKRYSQYTTAHSKVETLKVNLLNLAKTIGMYVYLSNDYDYIKPEARAGLINLYIRVCKICKTDPTQLVRKELGKEYRIFTDMYKYDFLSSKIQELSAVHDSK